MRFAGNYSNVGAYVQAGRAGAKGVADAFSVARANAPDYGGIAETSMNARSKERIAATNAEAQVKAVGLSAMGDVKSTQIKADAASEIADKKIGAQKMAGMVGALGTIAAGGLQAWSNNKEKKALAARDANEDARWAQHMEILEKSVNRESSYTPTKFDPDSVDLSDLPKTQQPEDLVTETDVTTDVQDTQEDQTDEEPASPPSSSSTPKPISSSTPSGKSSSGLTGLDSQVAAIIRSVESGGYGYGAFNQGGKKDGHESINPGVWSQSKHSGGKKMTDMTVGQILDRGKNHDNYSMFPTQQAYNDAGQVWATGAYQFIPDTLAEQVERSGISLDQPYSMDVQDQLFIDHARRQGNFQAWKGVKNVTPSERKILDQWIAANS